MTNTTPLAPHAANLSAELLNDPRFRSLPATQVQLLIFILAHRNSATGDSYPGIDRLAGYLRCNRSTIIRSLDSMEHKGVISITKRSGCVNVYRVLPLDNPSTRCTDATGDAGDTSGTDATGGDDHSVPTSCTGATGCTDATRCISGANQAHQCTKPGAPVRPEPLRTSRNLKPPTPEGEVESDRENESDGFDTFWSAWPQHFRKACRGKCERRWRRLGCDDVAGKVMESLRGWLNSEQWAKDDGQFIPAPLAWLNQQRWEAATPPPAAKHPSPEIDFGTAPITEEQYHREMQEAGAA